MPDQIDLDQLEEDLKLYDNSVHDFVAEVLVDDARALIAAVKVALAFDKEIELVTSPGNAGAKIYRDFKDALLPFKAPDA